MQELERKLCRAEKQVELHLQARIVRAPKGDEMTAGEARRRAPLVKRLNQLSIEINESELAEAERRSLLGRVKASLAALRSQSTAKRWLRERKLDRPMPRKRRAEPKKDKRMSVWTVSGGLPGLGKGH